MAEESGSSTSWLLVGLVLGGLTGGFLTYLYLKSRIPPQTMQAQMPPQIMPDFPASGVSFAQEPVGAPAPAGSVDNEEMWEIEKNPRGRVDRISVHRRVRPLG